MEELRSEDLRPEGPPAPRTRPDDPGSTSTATTGSTFTARLRQDASPTWDLAVGHRFVRELHTGAVPDDVMGGYLVQDHRFLDSFLMLIGAGIAAADTPTARLRLAQFAGEVAGDENTYFLRALDALGVDEQRRATIPDTEATSGFLDLFREAAASRDYAVVLAVLLVTEWLYLDWAQAAPHPLPESFVHAEWIGLHDNPGFRGFVAFLRSELDRAGADLERDDRDGTDPDGTDRLAAVHGAFSRAVDLELRFFDSAYADARLAPAARDLEEARR